MFEFQYVSKSNDNVIQFFKKKKLEFFILCKFYEQELEFFEIYFWNSVYTQEELLNLDNLLVAANLNRWKILCGR